MTALLEKLRITSPSGEELGEEFGEQFAPDPVPDEKPTRGRKAATKAPVKRAAPAARGSQTTAKMAKEVAEDLSTLLEGTAAVWGLSDQCCAPVLEQQAKPIANALVAILSRNPRLLAQFANTDIAVYTVQSIALFKALAPVGKAVYHNHVSKATDDAQEGRDGVRLGEFPAYVPR